MAEKVLLAYSGGLDTSCILRWLLEKDYEVICFIADVGQNEQLAIVREKALKIGASQVIVKDLRQIFVENYVWPAIQMGLIYEDRYLLGTSLARPCITAALIESARELGCKYISHGATGKGNDQVRFELSAYALNPSIQVIAPWRMTEFCTRFQGRQDLLDYARENNIPVAATPSAPWSMDANAMHVSYESGILEDPASVAPEDLYLMTQSPIKAPEVPTQIEIVFNNGLPIRCSESRSGRIIEQPMDILAFLNKAGGEHGVGRIDIVENRFVGIKSRGVYEAPGATILHSAHLDLELFCLDREVWRVKRMLQEHMSNYVYNGLWFSPEAAFTRKCLEESQSLVKGKVTVEIFKGNVLAVSREAIGGCLYNQALSTMDAHGSMAPSAASGFIEIQAIRLKEYQRCYGTPNYDSKLARKMSQMNLN